VTQTTTAVAVNPRTSRRRRVLSGVALVLACLTILLTTLAVWTHQVALNTDRFTSLVTKTVADPTVTDPIASRISVQVVDALEVQRRLADRLPNAIKPMAGALTTAITERIDARLKVALQNPRLQSALLGTVSFTHAQLVRLLRGETSALTIVDGYLTLDVFPVVAAALDELRSMGLIPADIQLPDLLAPEAPEVLAQRLEGALGVTLPPDFGTIRLMPVARLATAQTIVRVFDLVVILLIVLSALLVALTLWLASNRRRMLIYLGIGVIVAFLLARVAMNAATNAIIGGIADGDVAGAARSIVGATLQDLRGVTVLILIATVVLVIAAYLWGRPKWVVATTSYVTDSAGRAGSAAGAAASGGAAGVAGRAPDLDTIEQSVRENRSLVERFGIGAIVFALVWIAIGLEIALLGAALVIGFLLLLRAVTGPDEDAEVYFEAPETPVTPAGAASAATAAPPAAAAPLVPAVDAPKASPAAKQKPQAKAAPKPKATPPPKAAAKPSATPKPKAAPASKAAPAPKPSTSRKPPAG
jgi:hypothetical protein